jgi:hypothetical protein
MEGGGQGRWQGICRCHTFSSASFFLAASLDEEELRSFSFHLDDVDCWALIPFFSDLSMSRFPPSNEGIPNVARLTDAQGCLGIILGRSEWRPPAFASGSVAEPRRRSLGSGMEARALDFAGSLPCVSCARAHCCTYAFPPLARVAPCFFADHGRHSRAAQSWQELLWVASF